MLLELLPAVACAGGMALAMWLATRRVSNQPKHDDGNATNHRHQLTELEEEVARLRADHQTQPDHDDRSEAERPRKRPPTSGLAAPAGLRCAGDLLRR